MNLFTLSNVLLKSEQGNYSKPIVKITIAGVALGVTVMLLALFVTAGYKEVIREKIVSFGGHIRISSVGENYSFDLQPFDRNQKFIDRLEKNPQIKNIHFFATKVGILKTQTQVEGIVLMGIDATFSWEFFKPHIISGDPLLFDSDTVNNHIFISNTLAAKLSLQKGDKVAAFFVQEPPRHRSFIVAGLYETELPELDTRFILADLRHVQKLNNWTSEQISGIEIRIHNYSQLEALGLSIHNEIPYSLKAETIKQLYPNLFEWLALTDTNAIVLIVITIFICIITMISTFFIVIIEQTKNIGLLKTLGLNHIQILRLFLVIAAKLILRGLLWGNLMGVGIGVIQIVFHLIPLDPSTYFVSYIPMVIQPFTLLWINLLVFLSCLLTLLIPAFYISKRITPIEAIRFDS